VKTPPCPSGTCKNPAIARHGFYKTKSGKRRRYRCKSCGRTFGSTTGTPYYRLQHRRSTFDEVAALIVEGISKSAIARVQRRRDLLRAIVAARRPSCAESSSAIGLVSFVRFPWTRSSINGVSKETVKMSVSDLLRSVSQRRRSPDRIACRCRHGAPPSQTWSMEGPSPRAS